MSMTRMPPQITARFYAPNTYAANGDSPVATIRDILDWQVTATQVNRFDGHALHIAEFHRLTLLALPDFTTVDISQGGIGVIGRGVITSPEQQVKDTYEGIIALTIPNITDEGLEVGTGMGYIDAQEINQIVANLGALTTKGESFLVFDGTTPLGYYPTGLAHTRFVSGQPTGWSASYLDDGTMLSSSAPVTWNGLANAVANGNSVSRPTGGAGGYDGTGATGLPHHTDAAQDCALQWQIVVPTVAQAGLRSDASLGSPDWGFDFRAPVTAPDGTMSGTWRVIAGRALVDAATGLYVGNTSFAVSLAHPAGVPTVQYRINGLLVYTSILTPVAPFDPVALISTPGGEISNAIFTRTVPASKAWFQVQYDKQTQPGALLQLASDTGMFVRQGVDATGAPIRAYEFGPMNAAATITLRDGRGGSIEKLRANPAIRVVREITSYKRDVSNCFTVSTPLGGNTGPAQVTIQLLWRMLNDPTYESYYVKYGSIAAIFPEYDPNFTVHRTPMLKGGYEYYIVYEPAFGSIGYTAFTQGTALPAGSIGYKEGGPTALSQFVYPDQATIAQQEAAQRLLYKAWIELMKRAVVPHITITLTTIGDWRPPRAGDKVHLDYTQTASDRLGPWAPLHILTGTDAITNPDPRVLSVTRSASGDEQPIDTIVLSNLGKYEDTIESQAAGAAKQVAALQVTTQTGTSTSLTLSAFDNIDAGHPVVLPFFVPPTTFNVIAFYLLISFSPFRQPVTTADNPTGTHVVTVGGVDIELPLPTDLNLGGTFNADGSGATGTTDGFSTNLVARVWGVSGALGGNVGAGFYPESQPDPGLGHAGNDLEVPIYRKGTPKQQSLTAAVTKSAFTAPINKLVAKAKSVLAHIPAGTALADLPQHQHPVLPDITETTSPTGITIQIDSGDGVFVERTAQLIDYRTGQPGGAGGFTGQCVLEISRFVNPGRFQNLRLSSTANSNNGRGRVGWGTTVMLSVGGPGSIVQASQ